MFNESKYLAWKDYAAAFLVAMFPIGFVFIIALLIMYFD